MMPLMESTQMPMPNYEDFLQFEAQRRGWDDMGVARFENWRKGVAEVESNSIPTRTQGDEEDGIGRGKYQYENSAGSNTNVTARNRLNDFLPLYGYSITDLPEADRTELLSDDPDFAALSEETQDLLFLADKSMAGETRLNDLADGSYDPRDAWIDWHWKGSADEADAKEAQWNRTSGHEDPTAGYDWSFEELVTGDELSGSPSFISRLFGGL